MIPEIKFKYGKFAGKTLEEVQRTDPKYVAWAKQKATYLFEVAAPTDNSDFYNNPTRKKEIGEEQDYYNLEGD